MTLRAHDADTYIEFVEDHGAGLRRALCVALGRDLGLEATAEALSWGWEHWDSLAAMDNPVGYLYRAVRAIRPRSRFASRWDPTAKRALRNPQATGMERRSNGMLHEPIELDAASLRPGRMYSALTNAGASVVGEFLGIEVTHGDWAMLIHTSTGVLSLPLRNVLSVYDCA